jgi:hypothetical protein
MSADDVIPGLLERYPNPNNIIRTTNPFLESKVPSFFHGTIHAETTLMGLISYFFLDDHERNRQDSPLPLMYSVSVSSGPSLFRWQESSGRYLWQQGPVSYKCHGF